MIDVNSMILEGCVATNGVFDIVHVGHLHILEYTHQIADELGVLMVVCINSDSSTKRLKGESRPINKLEDRCRLLEALSCVSIVISFDEDTPWELYRRIKPAIIVKDSTYDPRTVAGADLAKIMSCPKLEGYSSSHIVNYIK
jgi:D-beta-D-heptose 7-phosphate kinase/D-beta-D-heptose 1-phosphate adenosyltransferase